MGRAREPTTHRPRTMLQMYHPPPSDPAARWVDLLWEWDGYRSAARAERIIPHGGVEVSWNLAAPHRFRDGAGTTVVPRATLIGARDHAYHIDTTTKAHLFGLVFRPGAVAHLCGVGMHELYGRFVPLADFVRGAELESRIGHARSAGARRRAVSDFFATLAAPSDTPESARLLTAWQSVDGRACSVQSVRASLGISAPTFVGRIQQQLGLRPAQVRQLMMLREAVILMATRTRPLVQVALMTGYCDQAHLNRAFRRSTGLTPRQFRPSMPDHPFNLPEADAALSFDPILPADRAAG